MAFGEDICLLVKTGSWLIMRKAPIDEALMQLLIGNYHMQP